MAMTDTTIETYLRGKLGEADISDETMFSALFDNDIEPCTLVADTNEKQRDLSLASLYLSLANGMTRTASVKDADGDWSHEEGGGQVSDSLRKHYLALANELRKKWGLDAVGGSSWGFRGGGFHDVRNYGNLH